ncbi:MAG: DUF1592 domain-containing protein, partial [Planctomycetales bacterium]|nr:DUF1592 domain-containing protein [Planctomycetales bacterium]
MKISRRVAGIFILVSFASLPNAVAQQADRGLIVLYDFAQGSGQTVRDVSGVGTPLDLVIEKSSSVRWTNGALVVESSTSIASAQPAKKVIDAVKRSNAITIEAWLKPANNAQTGPARIVSLSSDTSQRNVTLGQDKDFYDVRLRVTGSDNNGLPSTSSPKKSLQTRLSHIVFTRDAAGTAIIYIDGKQIANGKVNGNFSNWDGKHRLALANEITKDRPWLGELHRVAIYDRALAPKEVQQSFAAGAKAMPGTPMREAVAAGNNDVFDNKVAPLFAKHCLECHDSAIKKGGLDLSRKVAALAGGESGKVITPGKAAESLLWESVESNEMPKDRAPLSANEKVALRKWLDAGADWSVEQIDPAIYLHEGHAGEIWVQRLTVPEYIETVRSTVGVDISKEAREMLPPDLRADGFSNTAYNLNIDLKHVEAYSKLAEIIVSRMDVLKFAARFSKSQLLSTDDTMRQHVEAMGKWMLRGPLDERDVNNYSGIATTVASAGGDFKQAMTYMIEAMLQSPRFIYRIENQHGGGAQRPVTQYELASRLSYILWGSSPDEELMRAADAGDLADRGKLAAQVQRMLKDSRTIDRSSQFLSEWLDLGRLANLRPDAKKFPNWDAQLATDMRDETLAYFREVAWKQNRPLSDLLNAQLTYATPRLAEHYGLTSLSEDISQYDLSSVAGRGGILTQGSVLTVGGDGASMVSRGLFVLHDLLRGTVNAPPPCVNTTPPPTKAGLTQRGIAESRIADANCGVCHARFEPLAFGLEKFDGVGAFHERDKHGNALRDDGEILFPGEAKPVPYKTSAELMDLLANSERVRESLTWKVTQFALGRPLLAADAPVVAEIHKAAQQDGGTYASLITAIVLSDL